MALSQLQSKILRTLAKNRSETSYLAGGLMLNKDWHRRSDDIDIFHDTDEEVQELRRPTSPCLNPQATRRTPISSPTALWTRPFPTNDHLRSSNGPLNQAPLLPACEG